MAAIKERPLQDDLPFGARITGVDAETLKDDGVRRRILDIFEDRGLLVFEGMEPSGQMQLAVRDLFGPPQDHAMPAVPRADESVLPGVMDLDFHAGEADIFEVDGAPLSGWTPWHYDACYTKELYRGGVLRALVIPPAGGMTGFADGVQMYEAISAELRARFEELEIVYHPKLMLSQQRFGLPEAFHVVRLSEAARTLIAQFENAPRGIHPAIWPRRSGERVLHVSPWQAAGIYGCETPEGDRLLEALCREMYAKMTPYWHVWKPTDMVAYDNWRFLHAVSGHRPEHSRRVHRATIKGDYGLGRLETDAEPRPRSRLAAAGAPAATRQG